MKKLFLLLLVIILGGLIFLSLPQPTQAGLVPCGLRQDDPKQEGNQTVPCQLCHTFVLFNNVVDFLLFRIVPPLAVLMLVIGGFMYIFAYFGPAQIIPGGKGGPALLGQAKKLITSVVIGIVIMFGAWAIVNTFFQAIGVEEWTGLKTWWEIKGCPKEITAPPTTTSTPTTPSTVPPATSTRGPSGGGETGGTGAGGTWDTKTCYCFNNDCYDDSAVCANIYTLCESTEMPAGSDCRAGISTPPGTPN